MRRPSQAQAAFDRIRYMVSHAGVYRNGDQPTKLGIEVVAQHWNSDDVPNILVVWSGGREGGMAAAGTQSRLPTINELAIYTVDPVNSNRFVEIVIPTNANTIDFRAADFATQIRQLIVSPEAELTRLCDRIRICGDAQSADGGIGGVWFDLRLTPDETALASTAPESVEWTELGWAQGIASSGQGTATVNGTCGIATGTNGVDGTRSGFESLIDPVFWFRQPPVCL